jgi:hypothetical protein
MELNEVFIANSPHVMMFRDLGVTANFEECWVASKVQALSAHITAYFSRKTSLTTYFHGCERPCLNPFRNGYVSPTSYISFYQPVCFTEAV